MEVPAVLGLPSLPPWGPAVGGLSWPGGPGTALLGAGRPEPHGRCPSGSYFFFFVFKKKTVKTSWTFASGFPQGIFDSDWKRLLPIEQLLGLLFKLCLSGPFPWFLGYPQGADSRQGAWVARGAPTRARGPGSPAGCRLAPGGLGYRGALTRLRGFACFSPSVKCGVWRPERDAKSPVLSVSPVAAGRAGQAMGRWAVLGGKCR